MMTIALEAGDCRRAIAAGRALLKISPRHVPAHDTLGAAYIQMGDVDAAMRITNALIRLDPDTAAHHFKKALLCQHKGEIALAVQEFTEALLLDPNGPHAEDAREALQALDAHQLNQIVTLAMEDSVFRLKLDREPVEAAAERGFYLSETGNQLLIELSSFVLSESPTRVARSATTERRGHFRPSCRRCPARSAGGGARRAPHADHGHPQRHPRLFLRWRAVFRSGGRRRPCRADGGGRRRYP